MNQLEETLAKVLETPELLQQFYLWHTVEDIFYIIISVIRIALPFIAFRILSTEYNSEEGYDNYKEVKVGNRVIDEWAFILISALGAVIILFNCFYLIQTLLDLLYLLTEPKLYLIEYFLK